MALRIDDVRPLRSKAGEMWRAGAGRNLASLIQGILPNNSSLDRRPNLYRAPHKTKSVPARSDQRRRSRPSRIDFVLVPVNAKEIVSLRVDYTQYSQDRLLTIAEATEREDVRQQALELFGFIKGWDVEIAPGSPAPMNRKSLARLPHGTALAFALQVGMSLDAKRDRDDANTGTETVSPSHH